VRVYPPQHPSLAFDDKKEELGSWKVRFFLEVLSTRGASLRLRHQAPPAMPTLLIFPRFSHIAAHHDWPARHPSSPQAMYVCQTRPPTGSGIQNNPSLARDPPVATEIAGLSSGSTGQQAIRRLACSQLHGSPLHSIRADLANLASQHHGYRCHRGIHFPAMRELSSREPKGHRILNVL
jgi:hypothetical protein